MIDLIVKGGVVLYIIIAISVIALALIIERLFSIHSMKSSTKEFAKDIKILLDAKDYDGALNLSSENGSPLAILTKIAIEHRENSADERRTIVEENADRISRVLEGRLLSLSVLGYISPLLGLLGTVIGMIAAFMTIQQKAGLVNPGDLAGGIWEALLTTAAGLIVAIPVQLFYSYFSRVIDKYMIQLEISTEEIIDKIE